MATCILAVHVQLGDQLLLVSAATAVLGDDMWPASDLQRTRWAINNRVGKVRGPFGSVEPQLCNEGKPVTRSLCRVGNVWLYVCLLMMCAWLG
jgi:hypothetical protein